MNIEEIISKETIIKSSEIMDNHPKYSKAEKAVRMIFDSYPSHVGIEGTLIKVTVLNALYATSIFDIIPFASHIQNIKNIDDLLMDGNVKVIDLIRHGHNIISQKTGNERDFFSFATKYASFYNPVKFPIYDNLVANLLFELNNQLKLIFLKKSELRDYNKYKSLIDSMLKHFEMENDSYKTLDKGLWILSKYYYRGKKNVEDKWVNEQVETMLRRCKLKLSN